MQPTPAYLTPQQSRDPVTLFSNSYSFISRHQAVLQTRLRQESAVEMLMVPFLGLTAAQPAMLSSGIKMMCTGNTVFEIKLIASSRLIAIAYCNGQQG